jgi:hypothetical protein
MLGLSSMKVGSRISYALPSASTAVSGQPAVLTAELAGGMATLTAVAPGVASITLVSADGGVLVHPVKIIP